MSSWDCVRVVCACSASLRARARRREFFSFFSASTLDHRRSWGPTVGGGGAQKFFPGIYWYILKIIFVYL